MNEPKQGNIMPETEFGWDVIWSNDSEKYSTWQSRFPGIHEGEEELSCFIKRYGIAQDVNVKVVDKDLKTN